MCAGKHLIPVSAGCCCWCVCFCAQILLQVQQMSSMPQQQQYKGLLDALRRIPQQEGGVKVSWRQQLLIMLSSTTQVAATGGSCTHTWQSRQQPWGVAQTNLQLKRPS